MNLTYIGFYINTILFIINFLIGIFLLYLYFKYKTMKTKLKPITLQIIFYVGIFMMVGGFATMLGSMAQNIKLVTLISIAITLLGISLSVLANVEINKIYLRKKLVNKKRQIIYFKQVIKYLKEGKSKKAKHIIEKFLKNQEFSIFSTALLLGKFLDENKDNLIYTENLNKIVSLIINENK